MDFLSLMHIFLLIPKSEYRRTWKIPQKRKCLQGRCLGPFRKSVLILIRDANEGRVPCRTARRNGIGSSFLLLVASTVIVTQNQLRDQK